MFSKSDAVILYGLLISLDLLGNDAFSYSYGSPEPRFLLLPVRLGKVTFSNRSFVSTALDRVRFAKGSSGRHDRPMDLLRSVDLSS